MTEPSGSSQGEKTSCESGDHDSESCHGAEMTAPTGSSQGETTSCGSADHDSQSRHGVEITVPTDSARVVKRHRGADDDSEVIEIMTPTRSAQVVIKRLKGANNDSQPSYNVPEVSNIPDELPRFGRAYWQPNHLYQACFECDVKFTLMKRRHHCRRCGLIFCNDCCPLTHESTRYQVEMRLCNFCYMVMVANERFPQSRPIPPPLNPPLDDDDSDDDDLRKRIDEAKRKEIHEGKRPCVF